MSRFVYKVSGFAQTRDALIWVKLSAPNFKFGLTLEDVFAGLAAGYESVRPTLKDEERLAQLDLSRAKVEEAHALFANGQIQEGSLVLQEAEELFTTLRRIAGKKVSRQKLGETEYGANELDEPQ